MFETKTTSKQTESWGDYVNKRSKAVFSMIILTISVAMSVLFSINSNNNNVDYAGEEKDIVKNDSVLSQKTEVESSGNNITVGKGEKYFLVIEENILCAYRITSDQKEKISCAELNPLLVEADEVRELQNGIYADSYEDLCLYFEAYTS